MKLFYLIYLLSKQNRFDKDSDNNFSINLLIETKILKELSNKLLFINFY